MPLVSKEIEINGEKYLDGAIDCNVPLNFILNEGFDKIIVVLTRDEDYKTISKKLEKLKQYLET